MKDQKCHVIRCLRSERGATLLENTFALPFFIIFLILTFELLRVAFNQVSIQFVLSRVMRESTVLDAPTGPVAVTSASGLLSSLGLSFTAGTDTLTICPATQWGTALCPIDQKSFGDSSEPVVYELRRNVSFFSVSEHVGRYGQNVGLSLPTITLRAMAMGRNEPR